MPSQYEEQKLALGDGVEIKELLGPETWSDGILTCEVMRLGDYDSSGRRGIEGTGKKERLSFDTVIGAVGARVDAEAFTRNNIKLNAKGFPEVSDNRESSVPNVYIAGDCKQGAATVVRAIADAKAAAADILRKLKLEADFSVQPSRAATADISDLYYKKGVISELKPDNTDAYRCLSCNSLCEICVDVCPNRANVMVELPRESGLGSHQVLHIDRICNECGNCATFCPHAGKPYKDKLTVFCCEEDFTESENAGLLKTGDDTFKIRLEDKSVLAFRRGENTIPNSWIALIDVIMSKYEYLLS
jgi:putative selenate reductase